MDADSTRDLGRLEGKLDMLIDEQRRGIAESRERHQMIADRFDETGDQIMELRAKVERHQMRLDAVEPMAESAYKWTTERGIIERWITIKGAAIWGTISAAGAWIWHILSSTPKGG